MGISTSTSGLMVEALPQLEMPKLMRPSLATSPFSAFSCGMLEDVPTYCRSANWELPPARSVASIRADFAPSSKAPTADFQPPWSRPVPARETLLVLFLSHWSSLALSTRMSADGFGAIDMGRRMSLPFSLSTRRPDSVARN